MRSPPLLLTAKRDAQGGDDSNHGETVAAKLDRDHRRKPGARMNIVLDDHLQAQRRMVKKSDQQQNHAAGGERRPQPSDEDRIVAAGMRNHRRHEPQRQGHLKGTDGLNAMTLGLAVTSLRSSRQL